MKKIRILVVDDHPVFLDGLSTALPLKDPEIEVISTAFNGREGVEKEKNLCPDVVLLDIKMPVMDGVDAARIIRERNKKVKIIMLTTFDEKELISGALQAGANGYLLKDAPISEIIQAIHAALQGNVLISSHAVEKLTQPDKPPDVQEVTSSSIPEFMEMTSREKEILLLMAKGKENRRIAEELYISEKTVRNYVSNIYNILSVHNRTQAVLWAIEHDLIKNI